jgi:hypothetical protein
VRHVGYLQRLYRDAASTEHKIVTLAFTIVITVINHGIKHYKTKQHNYINSLNTKLNSICHLLALLEAHHIPHISRIRVKAAKKLISILIL